jgi:hypothetical protein
MLVWREGQSSAFDVAETAIKRRQIEAQIHDGKIHKTGACSAAVLLGGRNQARSEAGTL